MDQRTVELRKFIEATYGLDPADCLKIAVQVRTNELLLEISKCLSGKNESTIAGAIESLGSVLDR